MYRIARVYNAGMIVCIGRRAHPLARWTVLALMGLAAVACSKASHINPDDAARVRKIDTTVERIRQAYTGKDASVLHSLFMPLDSLRTLEEEIQRDLAVYDRITLDFTIDRVMVDGADAAVYFHWLGQWQRAGDEQPLRERGHAILRLVGHQTLTVSGVDGDPPFGMAGRRIQSERPRGR